MFRRTLLSLLIFSLPITPALGAWDLEGKVDAAQISDQKTEIQSPLQGGVKDENSLNPSLRVIPGRKAKPVLKPEAPKYFYPSGTKLVQYRGSTPVSSEGEPNPYPILRGQSPSLAPVPTVWHPIAPVSTYTITPRNGVMSWAEGYGVCSIGSTSSTTSYSSSTSPLPPSRSGVTSYAPGYETQKSTTNGGVTSYLPEPIAVRPLSQSMGLMWGDHHFAPVPVSHKGITSYAPGYEAINMPLSDNGIISLAGSNRTGTTRGGSTGSAQGYEVSINTPKNGVVCWDSRYESSMMSNGLIKQTIGGMWSSPSDSVLPGLNQKTDELAFKPLFVQPVVNAEHPLRAETLPLTKTGNALGLALPDAKMNWDEWYKRVARAIYARWQNASVGPGCARVLVTVTRDRALVGRVTEFWPAADVSRDVDEESNFKSEALNSVNLVSSFEIPEFPETSDISSVSFDVDLKRQVDGPTGIDVDGASVRKDTPEVSKKGVSPRSRYRRSSTKKK